MKTEKLLNTNEAARLLGLKSHTLSVWRTTGRYDLPYVRLGHAIRYREEDLNAWVRRNLVPPETKGGNGENQN